MMVRAASDRARPPPASGETASQRAYFRTPGFGHYCAAKAGIIAFTRSRAREIGERDINANCVAPGATCTPLLDNFDASRLEALRATIPKGELARVDQIVPAYLFLASDEASHMVGQTVSPNGGDIMLQPAPHDRVRHRRANRSQYPQGIAASPRTARRGTRSDSRKRATAAC